MRIGRRPSTLADVFVFKCVVMNKPVDFRELACRECLSSGLLEFDFTMAFQPIVDVRRRVVYGYEALVRGLNGESAYSIISQVTEQNRYRFDQCCRVKAISLAAELGLQGFVSINFLPNAVYRPELCIRTTLAAAREADFPIDRILFEITEVERVEDEKHLVDILEYYQKLGFKTALDDFGSGYSGLNLLAEVQPSIVKLDMALIRDIHLDARRQIIVRNTVKLLRELGCEPLAEGVETLQEFRFLEGLGIDLYQGFLFARPAFEAVEAVDFSVLDA